MLSIFLAPKDKILSVSILKIMHEAKINIESVEYPRQRCLFLTEGYVALQKGKLVYEKRYKKYIIFSVPI